MKQKINLLILLTLLTSCAPGYFQLIELSSENIKDGISGNDDIEVKIDFWGNGGTTEYAIFNKSKKTIYIQYDECQVIKNDLAYDLYDNSEYTSTRGITNSSTKKYTKQKGASVSSSYIYGSNSIYTPLLKYTYNITLFLKKSTYFCRNSFIQSNKSDCGRAFPSSLS